MYTRLSHKRTKKYYREIVDLAIEETQKLLEISPEIAMYRSILNQLIDIKHTIIEQCKVFSVMELYRKYSLVLPYKPNILLIHSILCYKLFANICKFLYLYTIILADIYA